MSERDKQATVVGRNVMSTGDRYFFAHPETEFGYLNNAEKKGYRLIFVFNNGVLLFRRKNWLERMLRL